ncbi:MAG: hypothetical protein KatS3mg101_0100 [Patescibacteria group bacterium]|nr:MAG: hypothetical protein KatS3mg101_0100 [Patescibacteria group bacterium]
MSEIPCVKCFSTLGVGSRMRIFEYLRKAGKATVGEIVDVVKLTQPTISYHLKEMKTAGLLENEKFGKEVMYRIRKKCPSRNEDCILSKLKFS